jgi:cyclopropane fatty-acyl-phospholipid synthase-like methyltransferase
MEELFTLGNLFVSDFLKPEEEEKASCPLTVLLDVDNGLVKLANITNKDLMYGKYWYRSGINQSMRKDLLDIVQSINRVVKLSPGDVWLDIACNDGTLLEHVGATNPGVNRIGIDPCDDSYLKESKNHADEIVQDYFTSSSYLNSKYGGVKPRVITTIAMFYDLEDPASFIKDVHSIIDKDGIWVMQMSYTPLMLQQLAFDNICHEHVFYYSLFNIKSLFENNGFKIMDCQLNSVNGGSFRVYAQRSDASINSFADKPYRDVSDFRVKSILSHEKSLNLDKKETWIKFFNKVENLKEQTRNFIIEEKSKGKKIWAYGASTKGNTLLQYFCLDSSLIDGIAERSPYKFGLRTVGTNIPIFSEERMRSEKPDYLLVLPWHFISEFVEREKDFLARGGKFIVPCPEFNIIGQ